MESCYENTCSVDVSQEEKNIIMFVDAIAMDANLEFVGEVGTMSTNDEPIIAEDDTRYGVDELFVLRDKRVDEGSPGAFPKVEVKEVMEKCTTPERAAHIIGILKGEENAVRLWGVTRIVGYYSRVTSWNKSKIGELRDRGAGAYKLQGGKTENPARDEAIDSVL